MKLLVLCTLFICGGLHSKAQQFHFIYLQSDNKQPFYVRLNERIFSSSSSGYLVIPKMTPGEHKLIVGFAKNEWPLQNLNVQVAGKDLGFALKNFERKGWGLFNLQTLEVINTASPGALDVAQSAESKTDNFSDELSKVVNTPSLREQKKESQLVPQVKEVIPSEKVDPEIKKSLGSIQKISTSNHAEAIEIVYQDQQLAGIDTISIMISKDLFPITNTVADKTPVQHDTSGLETKVESPVARVEAEVEPDPKFLRIEITNPNASDNKVNTKDQQTITEATPVPGNQTATAPKMINSDCKQLASDEDFLKIRKRMTSEKNDGNMITAALKMFRQKCYSTDQVRNLAVLFLKDEERYRFFDAAYPYVHDSQNFKLLESQLSDPYTITRFRAMIRN